MTHTPAPTPGHFFTVCDGCHCTVEVTEDAPLPPGWVEVILRDYVGSFAACSDQGAASVRKRELLGQDR